MKRYPGDPSEKLGLGHLYSRSHSFSNNLQPAKIYSKSDFKIRRVALHCTHVQLKNFNSCNKKTIQQQHNEVYNVMQNNSSLGEEKGGKRLQSNGKQYKKPITSVCSRQVLRVSTYFVLNFDDVFSL